MTNATYIKAFCIARAEGMSEHGADRFASLVTDHGFMREDESFLACWDRYVAGLDRLNFALSMMRGEVSA